MCYHNKLLYIIVVISALIFIGCATTYAPADWLPKTEDIPKNIYGGWITIITETNSLDSEDLGMQYSGEFIAEDSSTVFLLYDTLYQIPKNKIKSSILELDSKNATGYGLWTAGGIVSTISHGFFLIISAPVWLVTGIPTTILESSRDRYEAEYPDEIYWNEVKKFARFPQGVDGIDLRQLKPYNITPE